MFNGSQFFYSIPFYQLYPAFNCFDKNGKQITGEICTREHICEFDNGLTFSINWEDDQSL